MWRSRGPRDTGARPRRPLAISLAMLVVAVGGAGTVMAATLSLT